MPSGCLLCLSISFFCLLTHHTPRTYFHAHVYFHYTVYFLMDHTFHGSPIYTFSPSFTTGSILATTLRFVFVQFSTPHVWDHILWFTTPKFPFLVAHSLVGTPSSLHTAFLVYVWLFLHHGHHAFVSTHLYTAFIFGSFLWLRFVVTRCQFYSRWLPLPLPFIYAHFTPYWSWFTALRFFPSFSTRSRLPRISLCCTHGTLRAIFTTCGLTHFSCSHCRAWTDVHFSHHISRCPHASHRHVFPGTFPLFPTLVCYSLFPLPPTTFTHTVGTFVYSSCRLRTHSFLRTACTAGCRTTASCPYFHGSHIRLPVVVILYTYVSHAPFVYTPAFSAWIPVHTTCLLTGLHLRSPLLVHRSPVWLRFHTLPSFGLPLILHFVRIATVHCFLHTSVFFRLFLPRDTTPQVLLCTLTAFFGSHRTRVTRCHFHGFVHVCTFLYVLSPRFYATVYAYWFTHGLVLHYICLLLCPWFVHSSGFIYLHTVLSSLGRYGSGFVTGHYAHVPISGWLVYLTRY